jgi:hypothetical protein
MHQLAHGETNIHKKCPTKWTMKMSFLICNKESYRKTNGGGGQKKKSGRGQEKSILHT